MNEESKRIYINNIPETITQSDLEQKFAEYGSVSSVEIKKRKNIDSDSTQQFAYVTLSVNKNDLMNCFDEFANRKWKGHWISVQEAKESFMERLKRERLQNDVSVSSSVTQSTPEPTTPLIPYVKRNSKKVYYSGSSDEETSKPAVVSNGLQKHKRTSVLLNNGYSHGEQEMKIAKVEPISKSEQKRLQSLNVMRKNYQLQKQVLKSALLNIDSKPSNKIIFNEHFDDVITSTNTTENTKSSVHENKKALFDDDDEGEEAELDQYSFGIKEQFEGKKGQKLMQLQSRFKNDKRFAMDERFLEEDKEVETTEKPLENDEITLDEEKQKEFEILEQVLGKKIKHKPSDKDHDKQNIKMMLRFDPSDPKHSKFEINNKETKKKEKNVTTTKADVKRVVEDAPKPEVSKDTFYKIAVNLKDSLHESKDFSLANLFNQTIETENEKQVDFVIEKPKAIHQPPDLNTFGGDSSEDEDDTGTKPDSQPVEPTTIHHTRVGAAKIWTESFFFKHDDYRLQEGFDFIKRLEVDEQGDFSKLRRNLHEIVKAKVRNNQRKNRPFRKKLGGKKRLRVKRAMKR